MSGYSDLPVEPEQLEAIGRVVVEWSYLESVLEAAIWNLAQTPDDDIAAAITTHLGWRPRMDMLATLSELEWQRSARWETYYDEEGAPPPSESQTESERKEFRAIRAALTDLSNLRNEFVHKRWVRGTEGSPGTLVVTARGSLTRKMVGRSNKEIAAAAQGIAEQSRRLRALFRVEEAQPEEE